MSAAIDRIPAGDICDVLEARLPYGTAFLTASRDEQSLYRYAPDKWSIRQVESHLNDTERLFVFVPSGLRAASGGAGCRAMIRTRQSPVRMQINAHWAATLEEFRTVRKATLSFFPGLSRRMVAARHRVRQSIHGARSRMDCRRSSRTTRRSCDSSICSIEIRGRRHRSPALISRAEIGRQRTF